MRLRRLECGKVPAQVARLPAILGKLPAEALDLDLLLGQNLVQPGECSSRLGRGWRRIPAGLLENAPRGLEIGSTKTTIGLKVGALTPFVPRVDEK